MTFKLFLIAWSTFSANQVQAVPGEAAVSETLRIAKAISVVQPYLDNSKYIEYAMGIRRASVKYGIEPSVLIAIAQQESGFRENLKEGPAGEIGVCQIIKAWLENPRFQREFGRVTKADLKKPAKSFLFAAWILRNLKGEVVTRTLPYWSFYNSKRFENRLKYFIRVNKVIAALRRHFPSRGNRVLPDVAATEPVRPAKGPSVAAARRLSAVEASVD